MKYPHILSKIWFSKKEIKKYYTEIRYISLHKMSSDNVLLLLVFD